MDGERADVVLALDSDDGRLGALRDDGHALALRVLLRQIGQVLGDGGDVVGVEVVRVGVGHCLRLVAHDVVPVRGRLVEGVLEELGDEGGVEGEGEDLVATSMSIQSSFRSSPWEGDRWTDLVLLRGLLGQGQHGRHADRQMVSADKVVLAVLHNVPVLLQMLNLVVVCSGKVGAHAAVVARDDNTAAAGGLLVVDPVSDGEAGLLVGLLQDVGILVLADAAEVDDGIGGEQVLLISNVSAVQHVDAVWCKLD